MKNGICPKCNSTEIYRAYAKSSLDTGISADSSPILLNIHIDKGGIFGDNFTLLYLEAYLCQNCGYVEQYVVEREKLKLLPDSKNWKKV